MFSTRMLLAALLLAAVVAQLAALMLFQPGVRPQPGSPTADVTIVSDTESRSAIAVADESPPLGEPGIRDPSEEGVSPALSTVGGEAAVETGERWEGGANRSEASLSAPRGETSQVAGPSEIELSLRLSCVQIVLRETGGTGGGVVIAVAERSFEVLTAAHVVADRDDLSVFTFRLIGGELLREESRTVEVLAKDEDADLALIRVHNPILPDRWLDVVDAETWSLEVSLDLPAVGGVQAWGVDWDDQGYPTVFEAAIRRRNNVKRSEQVRAVSYWQLERASAPGVSGGPLVDEKGLVIGIASGNADGSAHYVNDVEIRRFLAAVPSR